MMAKTSEDGAAVEMETFIPKDTSFLKMNSTHTTHNDLEATDVGFDPFKARQDLPHPVSNSNTLTHLLKASLGTGILSMPAAFKASGLVVGVITTLIVSAICTHCAYILVTSAHELYRKTGKSALRFEEVAEEACKHGPAWVRPYGGIAKKSVFWGLFTTYFAVCSCFTVIIAKNLLYVAEQHINPPSLRLTILLLLIPLCLLEQVPNLKSLAPFSMVANVFMAISLAITFYYVVMDLPSFNERPAAASVTTLPITISVVIFAIEAIGVVMPLENNMKTPRNFVGVFGVLNQGMSFVTFAYIVLGFFGYLKYGEHTADSITHNLPQKEIAAQAVNILVALAVFLSFGLQFFVCLDIGWNQLKDRFKNKPVVAERVMRIVLTVACVLIATVFPTIVPFVGLIGAFFFSIVGLMCPVFIEILTFWDKGFGKWHWKIVKNVVIIITAFIAFIFGSKSALADIAQLF